jgi:hypothetical protein
VEKIGLTGKKILEADARSLTEQGFSQGAVDAVLKTVQKYQGRRRSCLVFDLFLT